MPGFAQEILACLLLLWRKIARSPFGDGPPKVDIAFAVARLTLFLYVTFAGTFGICLLANRIAARAAGPGSARAYFLLSIAGLFLFGAGVTELEPTLRIRHGLAIDANGFEQLPLSFWMRLIVPRSRYAVLVLTAAAAVFCLSRRTPNLTLLTSLLFAISSGVFGAICCTMIYIAARALLAQPLSTRILKGLAALGAFVAVPCILWAAADSDLLPGFALRSPDVPIPVAAVDVGPFGWASSHASFVSVGLCFGSVGMLGVIFWLDRRGYDRNFISSHSPRPTRTLGSRLVDQLLIQRESGTTLWHLALAAGMVASLWVAYRLRDPLSRAVILHGFRYMPVLVAYIGFARAVRLSKVNARDELSARRLTSALPIDESALSRARQTALCWAVLPLTVVLLPPVVSSGLDPELAWRSAVTVLALVAVCMAMPSVTLLSLDISSAGGSTELLGIILLSIPFATALMATTPLAEVPSMTALVAFGVISSRAAQYRARWPDEPAAQFVRDWPAWTALVVLAAFMSVRTLIPLVTSVGLSQDVLVAAQGFIYFLLLLGTAGRKRMKVGSAASFRLAPIACAIGTIVGLTAHQYRLWVMAHVASMGLAENPMSFSLSSAVLLVGLVPVAEEIFFRGWLQPALKHGNWPMSKAMSVIVTAVVFASLHVGLAFPSVLLLGLSCGVVYELGDEDLLPCILLHACYNAVLGAFAASGNP